MDASGEDKPDQIPEQFHQNACRSMWDSAASQVFRTSFIVRLLVLMS
jgi:hypothetical protein